jgi:hypothetical protein
MASLGRTMAVCHWRRRVTSNLRLQSRNVYGSITNGDRSCINSPDVMKSRRKLSMKGLIERSAFRYMPSLSVHTKATESKEDQPEDEMKDLGMKGKLKLLWERYGLVTVGTYLTTYIATLGGLYFALDSNTLLANNLGFDPIESSQRACDLFERVTGSTVLPGLIREYPFLGTLAVSWVITKVTEPIRAIFTIMVVPSVARALGRAPKKAPKRGEKSGTQN